MGKRPGMIFDIKGGCLGKGLATGLLDFSYGPVFFGRNTVRFAVPSEDDCVYFTPV